MRNFYWKKILAFYVLLLGLISGEVLAQVPGGSRQNIDLEKEKNRLERHYEAQLVNELSNYFDKNKFLVDTQVELSQVRVPNSFKRSEEREEPISANQLPGLPILPRDISREVEEDTVKPDRFSNALQVDRLVVRVIVDTSLSNSDIEFVEELASSTANIDVARGDQVRVDTRAFPEKDKDKDKDSVSETDTESEELEQSEESETDEATAFGFNKSTLMRWLIIGLIALILLLIIGFSIWIYRLKKNKAEEKKDEENKDLENLKAEIENLKTNEKSKQTDEELSPEQNATFEKDRTYITNQIISHPDKVANLLEQWIKSDQEDGFSKAAKAINAANPQLLSALNRYMERNNYKTLKNTLDNLEEMSKKEKLDTTQTFRKALQDTVESEDQQDSGHDMFQFLTQMTDDQIIHLIKDESNNMIAIALAQLDSNRASRILQYIDEERRPAILVQMGNIDGLSIETYKEAANYFSDKALKIISMKYVVADGVKSILNLIDTLPVDKQEEYVQSIAENDLDLAQRIRKYFVAFSDIPELEDEVVQEALEDLETETLISALVGADEKVVNKLMKVRPQREQQLIKYEIDNRPNLEEEEIEKARKTLIMKIRNQIKSV